MERIRNEELERIARLAGLSLSDEEKELLFSDLSRIVPYMERIAELDLSLENEDDAAVNSISEETFLREDRAETSDISDKILAQAPLSKDGLFTVPRTVE
ncbi:MAG: Asp-tRNA(Asn)/Glu-tRNA(Gln) amidotransferase subunit GatC [Clostridiales bacterium]|nr:Asp-tRNA(Asn)/Glu-tRNA(Gln) amidotransferase subunit GatC [Clostridiales bacterium]